MFWVLDLTPAAHTLFVRHVLLYGSVINLVGSIFIHKFLTLAALNYTPVLVPVHFLSRAVNNKFATNVWCISLLYGLYLSAGLVTLPPPLTLCNSETFCVFDGVVKF